MKRFKQHIQEALDKPYPLDKSVSRGGSASVSYSYDFKTDDGYDGEVAMYMSDDGDADIEFTINNQMHLTGTGDQFRIFATVRKAVEDFIKKERPRLIDFVGTKDGNSTSRQRLYTRFMKAIGKKYGYKTETSKVGDNTIIFTMMKPRSVNEEWFDQTVRNGEIFKNPTSKEWREYVGKLRDKPFFGGILVGNDVYLFSGGLHDDFERHLARLKMTARNPIRFRGEVKGTKIDKLHPEGGNITTNTAASRKRLFMNLVQVHKHKTLNKHMEEPNDPTLMMPEVKFIFSNERAFDEWSQFREMYK